MRNSEPPLAGATIKAHGPPHSSGFFVVQTPAPGGGPHATSSKEALWPRVFLFPPPALPPRSGEPARRYVSDELEGDLLAVVVLLPPALSAVLVGERAVCFDSGAPVGRAGEYGVERVGRNSIARLTRGVMLRRQHGADKRDDGDHNGDD